MTVNACQHDRDCRDPVRSKCMGELVRADLRRQERAEGPDHTYCLQSGCRRPATACSPGESLPARRAPAHLVPARHLRAQLRRQRQLPAQLLLLHGAVQQGLARGLPARPDRPALPVAGWTACSATAWPPTPASRSARCACQSDADCAKFDSIQGTFFCNDKRVLRRGAGVPGIAVLHAGRLPVPGGDLRATHQRQPLRAVPAALPGWHLPQLRRRAPRLPAAGGRHRPDVSHQRRALGLLARVPEPAVRHGRPVPARAGLPPAEPGQPPGPGLQRQLPDRRRLRGQPLQRRRLVRPGHRHLPLAQGRRRRPASAAPSANPRAARTEKKMRTAGGVLT